jgi:hypothetical protein
MRARWIAVAVVVAVTNGVLSAPGAGVDAQQQPVPPGHPPTGGQGQTPAMPPGHPPKGQAPTPSIPAPAPGTGSGSRGLTWTVPSGWTTETPTSSMRRAQYRINGPGGPAECVVFYFGPGQGGEAKANVDGWVSQFQSADGKPVDNPKTRDFKVADLAVKTVEVTGTYVGGMGGGPSAPQRDAMLLGAVVQGPDANWFFRAVGPKATLEKQRSAFDRMIRSVKRGTDKT